ncbi:uncharacterized protein LOC128547662 [Mercenaria mercenaria]|uniref:uncharacterized protein LOC128547662 n=1 Tax=Mercenaria mercenaria TaxID=6596 RepID=UPI00234E5CDC|nr:uncharacterized protein LOC128547662 [Mercenaria mercenaria]
MTEHSTSTKKQTITSPSGYGQHKLPDVEETCTKVPDIVIASICSFIVGVLCAVFVLLFLFRRNICKRKGTGKHIEEVVVLDDGGFNAEPFESNESKSGPDKKTYESLTSADSAMKDHRHSDHVYLGVDTRLREISGVKNVDRNALPTNSNEICKQAPVKEQNNAAKEDHVYNVLKSEESVNIYEDAKGNELHEHTYTGLNSRKTQDRNEEQGISKGLEYNDRTSECPDYFVLADEAKGLPANVTHKANEVQGCDLHTTEMTGVDPPSSDHAYFTLQKIEQSSSPTPHVEQKDEDSESENDTDGHAYHTIERV